MEQRNPGISELQLLNKNSHITKLIYKSKRFRCEFCKEEVTDEDSFHFHFRCPDYKNLQQGQEQLSKEHDSEDFGPYMLSVASYLSVKLALNSDVKNFIISIKNKASFGDIDILVKYENDSIKYAIKCKEANIDIEKELKDIIGLCNKANCDKTNFLLFTTCNTTSNFQRKVNYKTTYGSINLNIIPSYKSDIINVSSDSDNVFQFKPEAEENNNIEDIHKILPKLFLHTNQRVYPANIDDLLKKRFDNCQTICKDYMKYIENWSIGKLDGKYTLNKQDVILKLGELLLKPYIILPKMVNFKLDDFTVWNDVVERIDVIIVKNEPSVASKLCQPFYQTIENTLKVKFDSITKTVDTHQVLQNIHPEMKRYLLEEHTDSGSNIHLTKMYRVFWKTGQIPLWLLQNNEDSNVFILDVISFMKTNGVSKKFLIISEKDFQFFQKPPENLEIFSCLEDVKKYINLDDIKIKVADNIISVKKIIASDQFFLRWITPSIFFDMVLGRYTMSDAKSSETNLQSDLKIILDDETKSDVQRLLGIQRCEKDNLGTLKRIDPNVFFAYHTVKSQEQKF